MTCNTRRFNFYDLKDFYLNLSLADPEKFINTLSTKSLKELEKTQFCIGLSVASTQLATKYVD